MATPATGGWGRLLMRTPIRLLMIFFHPFVLLDGFLFHLLQLGLLIGSEHTVDLAMERPVNRFHFGLPLRKEKYRHELPSSAVLALPEWA